MSGNDGEEVTPVPIPNTEVKLFSADGSWGCPPVRVGRCQARRRSADEAGLFLFILGRRFSEGTAHALMVPVLAEFIASAIGVFQHSHL